MSNLGHRCDFCGIPMDSEGATGYCSERCLMWDFFGVPALKEDDLVDEIRGNQNGHPRTETVRAYSGLMTEDEERLVARALAELKFACGDLRSDE